MGQEPSKELGEQLDRLAELLSKGMHNSGNSNINVSAGGWATTLVMLIVLSIVGGAIYNRVQTRIDGLYDRLDAIYMMAPHLQPKEKNHDQRAPVHDSGSPRVSPGHD